jgi:5-formyltetrahydrofolate cyclo-ligase
VSRRILDTFAALHEYQAARAVAFYVDFGDEVRTRPLVAEAFREGKTVVCPYCEPDALVLYRLETMEDLAPGTWGILEPNREVRESADRRVEIGAVDLVMVPGVAFDPNGGRLGHGKGYYDKLLAGAGRNTCAVAVAFECQVFPEVPVGPHDVRMDAVITEAGVYRSAAWQAGGGG